MKPHCIKPTVISLFVLSSLSYTLGATYFLKENIVGESFYSHFDWEAVADPNHGRVNYVDQDTSVAQNLTYANFDTFILRTDYTTVLSAEDPGRNSVRIRSKNTYTTHVAITWPGIKETKESDKPKGNYAHLRHQGLVDIVEGINDQPPNSITLHTTEVFDVLITTELTIYGERMYHARHATSERFYHFLYFCPMTEPLLCRISGQLDCNTLVNSNAGCGVTNPGSSDYGPEFNVKGGGWYVVERAPDHISIWFWSRHDPSIPHELKYGSFEVDSRKWGVPVAYFPNDTCNPMSKYFEENNIIINLTLCGDWAGTAYGQSGCPSTCIGTKLDSTYETLILMSPLSRSVLDFVNNNPDAFVDAYFDFAAIRVYQPVAY
ncbi:LOW QUALITY PROTEIN: hypothetical protein CVT25_004407 [Psilocybe cyanescens]|uniref:GH16 domain-containing protein n=1 Tax=Psilocybe cyanescens TaxID=93625 RepID=A0A409XW01_PSICY|nr:LOW QUALITY PROTEIN: hypothetical protein CVT25_004407 [Psilocybe cyanescens]